MRLLGEIPDSFIFMFFKVVFLKMMQIAQVAKKPQGDNITRPPTQNIIALPLEINYLLKDNSLSEFLPVR